MLISRKSAHNCLNGRFHPSPGWVMPSPARACAGAFQGDEGRAGRYGLAGCYFA